MEERPIEARSDHGCVLDVLTRRLAAADAGDRAELAADALVRMLDAGRFDACCLPRYLALAPQGSLREVQIPIACAGEIQTRVIVWPVGSRDGQHPHADGWTVFVPVCGKLVTLAADDAGETVADLPVRDPVVLRSEDGIRHLVRNIGDSPALSVHISGA